MGLLSSIGKVVGIASSAAGILGGLKKPKGPGDMLKSTVKAGAKVGLHPLASIGYQGGYSEPASVLGEIARGGGEISDQLNAIDQRKIDQATTKKQEARQAVLDAATLRRTEAEIAEARSRTILNNANSKRVLDEAGTGAIGNGSLGGLDQLTGRKVQNEPTRDAPLFIRTTDKDGDTVYLLNEDVAGVGIDEAIAAGATILPQKLWKKVSKYFTKEYFEAEKARGERRGTPSFEKIQRRNREVLGSIRKGY